MQHAFRFMTDSFHVDICDTNAVAALSNLIAEYSYCRIADFMVLENRLSPWKTQVGHFGCSLSVKDPPLQHTKAQGLTERVDGGGIRGLSSIMILKDIMRGVNEGLPPSDILQPWQVFDMIGGTSTGGWAQSSFELSSARLVKARCHPAFETCSPAIAKCMIVVADVWF